MNTFTGSEILSIAELIHQNSDVTVKDVAKVVSASKSELLKKFSVPGMSATDVMLVIVCNELLSPKFDGAECEYHVFGLALRLLHKVIHHTDLTVEDILNIRNAFNGATTDIQTESLAVKKSRAIETWRTVMDAICGQNPQEPDVLKRSSSFIQCVREVTQKDVS